MIANYYLGQSIGKKRKDGSPSTAAMCLRWIASEILPVVLFFSLMQILTTRCSNMNLATGYALFLYILLGKVLSLVSK